MALTIYAAAVGIATKNAKGDILEVFYPEPLLGKNANPVLELAQKLGYQGGHAVIDVPTSKLSEVTKLSPRFNGFATTTRPIVVTVLEKDEALTTVAEAYLKLHLISHRQVKPHGTSLTGIFKIMPNVAWTSRGAIDVSELAAAQLASRLRDETLEVFSVDKFPKMTDYVMPSGVRIADTARVRLGAYLGDGTTVMHEGFVNFNAGSAGPNMVEGRISGGVFVGAGSDLGGGASTMGTLSGGGDRVISIGRHCLIGANAGIGIPLGDNCTVESGLYLTATSKVRMITRAGEKQGVSKAADLAGKSNLLFRRNSLDGAIECLPVKAPIALNDDLHAHN